MHLAYFTNIYPAVTHTFVRREIRALEALGNQVSRFAVRCDENIVDIEDVKEKSQTKYISKVTVLELLRACLAALLTKPLRLVSATRLAVNVGWRSDRGVFMHLLYLVEAILLAYWSEQNSVEHLHAHFGTNSAAIAMLAAQISKIPYSFTAHGPEEFQKAPLLSLDQKLGHAKFSVCVSAFGRSQFMLWSQPAQWPKIAIVHCGLDKAFFEAPVQPPSRAPRFVCVGRLARQKGQLVLVAAARRLRDEGFDFEAVLVGDGPMRPYIEEAIERADLQRQVTITGWISGDQVKREIEASRIMVLPSFSENMPVVIMESLALGRPVISTYIAGIPELIHSGKTGWLVPAGDEVALSEAMRKALATPLDRIATMGAEGRLHILKHHEASTEASKLSKLFEAPPNA